MYHYTYKITTNNPTDSRKYYIGCRSCSVWPSDDNYLGSCKSFNKWQKVNGINDLSKEILAIWSTRELAIEHEIRLHELYNVGVNEMFWNRAKQSSPMFDTTGTHHTPEQKRMKSELFKNIPRTKEWRENISKSRTGYRMTEITKAKLSKAKKGIPLSSQHKLAISEGSLCKPKSSIHKDRIGAANKGKKRSPEHCQKASDIRKGKPAPYSETRYANIECPSCGKIGMKANMKRYHFDNCKKAGA